MEAEIGTPTSNQSRPRSRPSTVAKCFESIDEGLKKRGFVFVGSAIV